MRIKCDIVAAIRYYLTHGGNKNSTCPKCGIFFVEKKSNSSSHWLPIQEPAFTSVLFSTFAETSIDKFKTMANFYLAVEVIKVHCEELTRDRFEEVVAVVYNVLKLLDVTSSTHRPSMAFIIDTKHGESCSSQPCPTICSNKQYSTVIPFFYSNWNISSKNDNSVCNIFLDLALSFHWTYVDSESRTSHRIVIH